MMSSEIDEIKRIGNKKMLDKKMKFQHWWFINRGYAKVIINLGGLPVFKLQFFCLRMSLINNGMLINPDLTLYYSILTMVYKPTEITSQLLGLKNSKPSHHIRPVRECNSHHPQQDSQWGLRCNRRVNRRAITSHLLMLCLQMSRMPYSPPRAARKKMAGICGILYIYMYIYQYVYMYIFCEYVSKYRMIM